jgi:hypothetical protein
MDNITVIFFIFLFYQINLVFNYAIELLRLLHVHNSIGGVMVSLLASSAVDRGFNAWSGQTKDYKIGICCFSTKHAASKRTDP